MIHRITAKLTRTYHAFHGRKTVAIHEIRCQRSFYSELEGFSGKPIEYFPPSTFFKRYLSNPTEGHDAFFDWYRERFYVKEAWKINKKDGGMMGGSLEKTLAELYEKENGCTMKTPSDASSDLINRAIEVRVQHYLQVLQSIREKGYVTSMLPPIYCRREKQLYYLENGHHRAAALWALQHPTLEVQLV